MWAKSDEQVHEAGPGLSETVRRGGGSTQVKHELPVSNPDVFLILSISAEPIGSTFENSKSKTGRS
jgi:hypothetical protein